MIIIQHILVVIVCLTISGMIGVWAYYMSRPVFCLWESIDGEYYNADCGIVHRTNLDITRGSYKCPNCERKIKLIEEEEYEK